MFYAFISKEEKLHLYRDSSIKLKLLCEAVWHLRIIDIQYPISNSVLFFPFPFVLAIESVVKFK